MSFVHKFTAKNDFDRNFSQIYLENYIFNHFAILHACLLSSNLVFSNLPRQE
jgi:hypothetical protein